MDGEGIDIEIRIRVVRRIEGAVRIQSRQEIAGRRGRGRVRLHGGECTSDHNLAVTLKDHRADASVHVRVKGNIEASIRINPRDPVAGNVVDRRERTGHQHAAIRLNYDRGYGAIQTRTEELIQRSVWIEANEIATRGIGKIGEQAPKQDRAIGLNCDGLDFATETRGSGGKGGAQRAVCIEPGEAGQL